MEQNKPMRSRRQDPAQRNRKLQGQWLTYLLVGVIAVFLILSLLIPDKAFSESENRNLAQFPGGGSLQEGTFLSDLSSWFADQFPGRDGWMSLDLAFRQLLGQKESSGVYLGRDHYLMQVPSAPDEAQVQRNLEAINAFGQAHPELNMVMSIVPNAVTVHADKLPDNAPVRDQKADLQSLQDRLTGARFVDVTDNLLKHKDQYLYYKTDHHWTSLAAAYAFEAIAPELNIAAPDLSSYTVYPVSKGFEGTLSAKSGSHKTKDQVDIYVPATDIEYFVTYPDSNEKICSLYNRAALEQKDHYTVFFGGNYSRVDITTTADTGRSLLLFKDSYANCFVQFLYPYFDHITMIDPRYYYDNLDLVLNGEGITDVLFLYNLDTYLSDSSLADVLG